MDKAPKEMTNLELVKAYKDHVVADSFLPGSVGYKTVLDLNNLEIELFYRLELAAIYKDLRDS